MRDDNHPTQEFAKDVVLSALRSPEGRQVLFDVLATSPEWNRTPAPEPLLTLQQTARYLSVSVRTVETLIAAEDLVPARIGGQRRFQRATLDAYVRRSTRTLPQRPNSVTSAKSPSRTPVAPCGHAAQSSNP